MTRQTNSTSYMSWLLWPFRLILMLLQAAFFGAFIISGWFLLQMYGLYPVQVPVSGASMMPTLPEEGYVSFRRYVPDTRVQSFLTQAIGHGDIVVFENAKTHEELERQKKDGSGFVKRVIGLPGDRVVIRDGFVYVNNKPLTEQYILKPRSTFGAQEMADCEEIHVPPGRVLVLGDNRKVSMDSRQIGLISYADIQYYIPFRDQPSKFGLRWRDPSHDLDFEHESLFDQFTYLELLNAKRKDAGLGELTYNTRLEKSANLRAQVILKHNDFSFEGKKSGYSMADSLADAGYSNIIYGEFPMTGYYDAQELFDAFLEQPESTKFLLNKDYSEIGVSTFIGEIDACPVQVVVQHLAGYIPPVYHAEEISSWEEGVARLKSVQPGWQKLKEYEEVYGKYKTEVDRINDLIALRIARYEKIVSRMKATEWLTAEEKNWVKEDKSLSEEHNRLSQFLNQANQ